MRPGYWPLMGKCQGCKASCRAWDSTAQGRIVPSAHDFECPVRHSRRGKHVSNDLGIGYVTKRFFMSF